MRVRFGGCVLDAETRQLFVDGQTVHLQPKAFQFLELLVRERPRAVSKEEIHDRLWPGTFISDSTLTSLLTEIRAAIGDSAHEPRFVRTVHRFGYAFSGSARETRESAESADERGPACWLLRGRRRIPLEAGETIIGRDPGAAISLDDASVSRRHARIVVSAEGATLEDLGSKNGTFLKDARIKSRLPLADGDKIRIGSVPLTIRIFPVPETTETASQR
jgi:DNA-binding winged helix-turn-helix (wHTH) protein